MSFADISRSLGPMLLFIGLYLMIRTQLVFVERQRILFMVSALAREAIDYGKDELWRYDSYSEVSFDHMMLKFWKPIKSFYKDHPCITMSRTVMNIIQGGADGHH